MARVVELAVHVSSPDSVTKLTDARRWRIQAIHITHAWQHDFKQLQTLIHKQAISLGLRRKLINSDRTTFSRDTLKKIEVHCYPCSDRCQWLQECISLVSRCSIGGYFEDQIRRSINRTLKLSNQVFSKRKQVCP